MMRALCGALVVFVAVRLPARTPICRAARSTRADAGGAGSATVRAAPPTAQTTISSPWAGERASRSRCPSCCSSRSGRRRRSRARSSTSRSPRRRSPRPGRATTGTLSAQLSTARRTAACSAASPLEPSTHVRRARVDLVARAADRRHDRSPRRHALHAQRSRRRSALESTYWLDDVTGSITQPLLKGRGRDALRRATSARRRSPATSPCSRAGSPRSRRSQAVVSAYWDLVLAERQVAITEQSLALARERLRVTADRRRRAARSPTPRSPRSQQIIATREEDVLNGELAVLERVDRAAPRGRHADRRRRARPARRDRSRHADDASSTSADAGRARVRREPRARAARRSRTTARRSTSTVTENGLLPQLDLALHARPARHRTRRSAPPRRTSSSSRQLSRSTAR